jgi:hypothetical protein
VAAGVDLALALLLLELLVKELELLELLLCKAVGIAAEPCILLLRSSPLGI